MCAASRAVYIRIMVRKRCNFLAGVADRGGEGTGITIRTSCPGSPPLLTSWEFLEQCSDCITISLSYIVILEYLSVRSKADKKALGLGHFPTQHMAITKIPRRCLHIR